MITSSSSCIPCTMNLMFCSHSSWCIDVVSSLNVIVCRWAMSTTKTFIKMFVSWFVVEPEELIFFPNSNLIFDQVIIHFDVPYFLMKKEISSYTVGFLVKIILGNWFFNHMPSFSRKDCNHLIHMLCKSFFDVILDHYVDTIDSLLVWDFPKQGYNIKRGIAHLKVV